MSYRRMLFVLVLLLGVALPSVCLAEPVTLTGQVLGPNEQPLAGAQVLATYLAPGYKWTIDRTRSNTQGQFSHTFEVQSVTHFIQVAALKVGLALDWCLVGDEKIVTLRLGGEPAMCAGTVTDPEGNPLAGAHVSVRYLDRPEEEGDDFRRRCFFLDETILCDVTDQEGRFEIAGLSPDEQVSLVALATGRERLELPKTVPADTDDLTIVLRLEVVMAGRLTHQAEPVAGVRIFCTTVADGTVQAETVSAEDGTYKLAHLSPGVFFVMFDPPEGLTAPALSDLRLEAGEHFTEGDFHLTPGGLVRGTVTEAETGHPMIGAHIGANGPARPQGCGACQVATADEHGN